MRLHCATIGFLIVCVCVVIGLTLAMIDNWSTYRRESDHSALCVTSDHCLLPGIQQHTGQHWRHRWHDTFTTGGPGTQEHFCWLFELSRFITCNSVHTSNPVLIPTLGLVMNIMVHIWCDLLCPCTGPNSLSGVRRTVRVVGGQLRRCIMVKQGTSQHV